MRLHPLSPLTSNENAVSANSYHSRHVTKTDTKLLTKIRTILIFVNVYILYTTQTLNASITLVELYTLHITTTIDQSVCFSKVILHETSQLHELQQIVNINDFHTKRHRIEHLRDRFQTATTASNTTSGQLVSTQLFERCCIQACGVITDHRTVLWL